MRVINGIEFTNYDWNVLQVALDHMHEHLGDLDENDMVDLLERKISLKKVVEAVRLNYKPDTIT